MSAADDAKRIVRAQKIGQYLFVPGTFDGWNCRAVDGSGAGMRVRERENGSWEWEASASAEEDRTSMGLAESRDEAIENCVVYMQQLGVDMGVFPTETRAARALVENGEVMPVIAVDFNDAQRYNTEVRSRLVLFLPVTDYRPEAMRVSERISASATWYEVESYSDKLGRWIEQKSHAEERKALDDIANWYPAPAARGSAINLAQKSGEFFTSSLIAMQRGALDSHEATGNAILALPRIQSSHGEVIRYEDVCKLLSARYDKPAAVSDVKRWADGDVAKFGKNNEHDVQVFPGLFRVSGFGLGNYYGADHVVEWLDDHVAGARADAQGVKLVRWSADQSYAPMGLKLDGARVILPGQGQGWDAGREAKSFAEAKELAEFALARVGVSDFEWKYIPMEGYFADVFVSEDQKNAMRVGALSNGAVSINGDAHSPVERFLNVSLGRVDLAIKAALELDATNSHTGVHVDLSAQDMASIEKAVEESKWMPPQYMRNDWMSDVCRFLREGPAAFGVLTQDWDGGHVAKDFAEGKELATLALKRAGLVAAGWKHKPQFAAYWEFSDVKVGEDQKITLGVSSGGVVQVNGDPFTKRERKMNVTLAAVQESVAAAVAQLQSPFKSAVHVDPRDVQPNALNQRASVLPEADVERIVDSHLTHGVLGSAVRHREQLIAIGREMEQAVLSGLDAQREVSGLPGDEKTPGFVFAFPEMNSAERDELLEALRDGGNTVVAVYGDHSEGVLKAAHRELAGDDHDLGMG